MRCMRRASASCRCEPKAWVRCNVSKVLGRGLSNASSDEADQVTAAASALSAGSGILASQLGAKLGFDDAGVSQSRTLGG